MAQWLCPQCGRYFGRANQSHICDPGLTLKEYLAAQPAAHRPIYRAVLAHLKTIGPIDIDPVSVGIMIKRSRTFCELRPKRAWVELGFKLSRPLADPRIARSLRSSTHRQAHVVRLRTLCDFDAQVRGWLVESYFESRE